MHQIVRSTAAAAAAVAAALFAVGCEHAENAASTAGSAAASMGGGATSAAQTMGSAAGSAANSLKDKLGMGGTEQIKTPNGEISVAGPIGAKYEELGGQNGALGLPKSGAQEGPNGGKFQEFDGGAIYWSPTTGAHNIWGDIRTTWQDHGGAAGALGYPTTDEKDAANGGKEAQFTGGKITWMDGHSTVTTH
ncbi:MAG: esterase [Mycobacteriaceae bacterium]|nr:esterase [Mycobacteriaceae bacterium]